MTKSRKRKRREEIKSVNLAYHADWDDSLLIKSYDSAIMSIPKFNDTKINQDNDCLDTTIEDGEVLSVDGDISPEENKIAPMECIVDVTDRKVPSSATILTFNDDLISSLETKNATCVHNDNNAEKVQMVSPLRSKISLIENENTLMKGIVDVDGHDMLSSMHPDGDDLISPFEIKEINRANNVNDVKQVQMVPPLPSMDVTISDLSDQSSLHSMLTSWYMCGFHTGLHLGLKQGRHTK
ncbi:hypothetical protein GJ496_001128 [Pomphorhynchus laevis]|nr:hypothetical protein GJ496_001128 [Pomphorhynchus laevis]